jgi:hypothetical protein
MSPRVRAAGVLLVLALVTSVPLCAQCDQPTATFSPLGIAFLVDTDDFSESCAPFEAVFFTGDFKYYLALTFYPCSEHVYWMMSGRVMTYPTFWLACAARAGPTNTVPAPSRYPRDRPRHFPG